MSDNVEADDTMIIFICRNCGDHMATSLESLKQRPEREIWAPNLCPPCGKYPPEKIYSWVARAMVSMAIRRDSGHSRRFKHRWMSTCNAARTRTVPRYSKARTRSKEATEEDAG